MNCGYGVNYVYDYHEINYICGGGAYCTAMAGPCNDPHPSQNMNHMFSLEASRKLGSIYPRALLSAKRRNTNFLPS